MELFLSRVHFPVTTLGPGRRIGIWFQGCSIRCSGCISADTWALGRDGIGLDELLAGIRPWLEIADGITVSGGEPFDQPEALIALLAALRGESSADILVYSGYPLERLVESLAHAQGLIDALISDPYDEAHDQTLALRGSDNQRLSLLTELGRLRFAGYERPLTSTEAALDLMFDAEGSVWMAGIPRRGDLVRLREVLARDGHRATISAHVPRAIRTERTQ